MIILRVIINNIVVLKIFHIKRFEHIVAISRANALLSLSGGKCQKHNVHIHVEVDNEVDVNVNGSG